MFKMKVRSNAEECYQFWLKRYKRALRKADYRQVDRLLEEAVHFGFKIPESKNYIVLALIDKHQNPNRVR